MNKAQPQELYLIDISAFIFRAYYAVRHLSNKKGTPTNAVYGVATMLARLFEEVQPYHCVVVYDSKEPSFRKEIFDQYKSNRSAPPDDLIPQFDLIEQLIRHMRLSSLRKSGIEADDLIATLCREWLEKDPANRTIIVTGDKDLMQLVNDQVSVLDTMKSILYTAKEVEEKFEVPPGRIRDYLSLVGDSSDFIPGVQGIGPKGAVDLIRQFGSLHDILSAAEQGKVSGKKGESLKTHHAMALLSYDLVTLREHVEHALNLDTIQSPLDPTTGSKMTLTAEGIEFLRELDFHSLAQKWQRHADLSSHQSTQVTNSSENNSVKKESVSVESSAFIAGQTIEPEFKTLHTIEALRDLVVEIEKHQKFCFDFETTSLNPRQAKIVGVALSTDQKTGYYIPLLHQDLLIQQLPSEEVFKILKPLFANPQVLKIAQNLKYDWSVLTEQTDLVLEAPFADTMIGDYVIDVEGRHSMDVLAMKYLGYTCLSFEEVCGKGKNQITFDQVSIEKATRYSAEDAWVTFCLWEQIAEQLKQKNLVSVYETIDLPLVKVLMKMELTGVTVDQNFLKQLSVEFDNELQMIEKKILAYVPQGEGEVTLNLNSPKQLSEFLFEQLKLPPQSKTKTGYSTDADVLTKLAPLHEVPRLLLEYREISKLKGTYVDPIPLLIDTQTQKVHAGFHQTVAATGRLSSSDPNLQNIPIRSERGLRIRNAFIASEGFTLCSADYSQIELRILAHMSGDPDLEESFKLDLDVHRRTAAEIFSKPQSEINDEERSIAKAINFGLMYGKTPFGLAQELGIPQSMAKEMIERYFKRYHGVKVLLDRLIQKAKELGYAETLSGRRRLLPDLKAKNPMVRQFSERMAMNTPIQGTASDLMKIAMIRIDQALESQKLKSRLIIQVHDEVILEVAAGEESVIEKLVRENMESAMTLSVPLKVNMSFGKNWKEL